MTKEEIYVKLGYRGEYTKEIRRRLRELIKKYHPDLNQGEDTTMKILNEVKDEIENNRVDEIFYQTTEFEGLEDELKDTEVSVKDDYFKNVSVKDLTLWIDKLKTEKEVEYNKLLDLDKNISNLVSSFKNKLQKYEEEKIKIDELNRCKAKINYLYLVILVLVFLFMTVISIYTGKLIFLVVDIITIIAILILSFYYYQKLNFINKMISISYANKNTYYNDVLDSNIRLSKFYKIRFLQYMKYRRKSDDVQLYSYELSKKNDKSVTMEKNTIIKR